MPTQANKLLQNLNSNYTKLHKKFEDLFWAFKMGKHSVEKRMNEAEKSRDQFRSNPRNLEKAKKILAKSGLSRDDRKRLKIWENFFQLYQEPPELTPLRDEIAVLEGKVAKKLAKRKEGYTDPKTGKFVKASVIKMRMLIRTSPDENLRKACFDALEKLSLDAVDEFVKLVDLRNQFARGLGFEDFYAYRLRLSEGMTKKQVFGIFDDIYKKTKRAFAKIKALEKSKPGLRKPWNFGYMMAGSFTLEEDPYFGFDEALTRWGKSFAALGIDFKSGALQLDLLDRRGKYNNGFCHYPLVVNFKNGKRNSGSSNFTCNVVCGQTGAGHQGMVTLFHEGGHAADRLNSGQTEVCLNTEWPPASTAWAETHSQFLDTMFSSIEWRTRYAKDKDGNPYPFDLFERKIRQLSILAPLALNSIMMVPEFEREIYEEKNLNSEKVVEIAKKTLRKYMDYSSDSLLILLIPHIYDWESSAYYHAYGLAILALEQWRKYFYEKYGYIVDNPKVGREMTKVWELGSAKTFAEFVKIATGKELSADAFLEDATIDTESYLARARKRIKRMEAVPEHAGPVQLNVNIRMLHGKKLIADNSASFEDMAQKYKEWLQTQKNK